MPLYESETAPYEELRRLEREYYCAECGGMLLTAWCRERSCYVLRCGLHREHEGLGKKPQLSNYEQVLEDDRRRRKLVEKVGTDKATALQKYEGVKTLTLPIATDLLKAFWPHAEKASPVEFKKALGLCLDYGLDPRINDLHMLPFKVKDHNPVTGKVIGEHTEYVTYRGISAVIKVARRNHPYMSHVDGTPRYMTEAEEKAYFKTVDPDMVRFIVKLKDLQTGAEGLGVGQWPKKVTRTWWENGVQKSETKVNNPKGIDKGNTMENMAGIHAERQAVERLYPAEMAGMVAVPVIDERSAPDNNADPAIEGEGVELPDETSEDEPPPASPPAEDAAARRAQAEQDIKDLFPPDTPRAPTFNFDWLRQQVISWKAETRNAFAENLAKRFSITPSPTTDAEIIAAIENLPDADKQIVFDAITEAINRRAAKAGGA